MSSNTKKRRGRKPKTVASKPLYDENGIHIESKLDLCDCLDEQCPGCYFPCPKCASEKCGNVCRRNRDFMFFTEYEMNASNNNHHQGVKKTKK